MNNKEKILREIERKRKRCYKIPTWGMPKTYFEQVSVHNWAVDEIIKEIKESDFTPPMMIVEDFIKRMEDYSCENSKNSRVFSIAKDAGEWILDILITINERRN